MEKVKVIIWGLGAMGSGVAEMLLDKKGVDIVGVAGREGKLGKSMYDFLSVKRGSRPDVVIGSPEEVIREKSVDVVLLCTDSFTRKAFDRIKFILEKKINCVTSAEEMAYPA
ncbi:MAG: dihydrodipicolinate reductase, partial [Treponema sp.]|nr:dihydrodipicolinate reductase [Treponema sp.]